MILKRGKKKAAPPPPPPAAAPARKGGGMTQITLMLVAFGIIAALVLNLGNRAGNKPAAAPNEVAEQTGAVAAPATISCPPPSGSTYAAIVQPLLDQYAGLAEQSAATKDLTALLELNTQMQTARNQIASAKAPSCAAAAQERLMDYLNGAIEANMATLTGLDAGQVSVQRAQVTGNLQQVRQDLATLAQQ